MNPLFSFTLAELTQRRAIDSATEDGEYAERVRRICEGNADLLDFQQLARLDAAQQQGAA